MYVYMCVCVCMSAYVQIVLAIINYNHTNFSSKSGISEFNYFNLNIIQSKRILLGITY